MSEAQAGHSFLRLPERRPQSIRRTSSVQCWFPSGADGDRRITAIARDLFTGHDSSAPQVLARERLEMTVGRSRDIGIARDESNSRDLDFMTGLSFGRPIRGAVATHFSKELAERSLFIRLLDEIPGPIGLAHAAFLAWSGRPPGSQLGRPVEGLCVGYRPGSSAVLPDKTTNFELIRAREESVALDDDRWAWHSVADTTGPSLWRLRALDVWHEDNVICANTQFQDSGSLPDSGNYRRVMHEYRVTAIIDPCDFVLRAVEVTPGMLPFPTCLAAPESAGGLVGHPVSTFGKLVSMDLTGTAGCTHLNEALKALQDVPAIAREVRSSC
jgi:hypothetical protein